jgi:hypothetical protein
MTSDGVPMGLNPTPQASEEDARRNVPTEVSFTEERPGPYDDSLPLDGAMTSKDTEPTDQEGLHPEEGRILRGSEATSTASEAVDVSVLPPPDKMSDDQIANTQNP